MAIDHKLVSGPQYRALSRNKVGLEALATPGYRLHQGDESTEELSQAEALEQLWAGAKKRLSIQRLPQNRQAGMHDPPSAPSCRSAVPCPK